jgi:TetR/AcrR family transcriptional regulator, transcriptional repressor for nem operon
MAEKKRQRAPRKTPDFDHVVAVTTRLLQEKGDPRLRIEDVMAETGIAKSSLYAKFGGRDGLVAAALAKQFEEIVTESLDGLRFAVERSSSSSELQRLLAMILKMTLTSPRDSQRMTRIAVLANTIGEPTFRSHLEEAQTALTDGITDIITSAAARGLVAPAYEPRTIANFVQAYTLGRVLVSFDRNRRPDEIEEWIRLVGDILGTMLFPRT